MLVPNHCQLENKLRKNFLAFRKISEFLTSYWFINLLIALHLASDFYTW